MEIDSIIFDLDGTLWDSTDTMLEAWNSILKDVKEVKGKLTREMLTGVMGMRLPDIAKKFLPYLDDKAREDVMKKFIESQDVWISKKGGKLYDGLSDTLKKLSERHPLFIVSNCQVNYLDGFLKFSKLEKYFKGHECSGNTGLNKGENIKLLMDRYGLKNPVYVGDTILDQQATEVAGTKFIYAGYGFGKATRYDYKIEKFDDLLKIC